MIQQAMISGYLSTAFCIIIFNASTHCLLLISRILYSLGLLLSPITGCSLSASITGFSSS